MRFAFFVAAAAVVLAGCKIEQPHPVAEMPLRTASSYFSNQPNQSGPTPPLPGNYQPGYDLTYEDGQALPVQANGEWTTVMIETPTPDSELWRNGFKVMTRKFADPQKKDKGITLELEVEKDSRGFRFGLATEKKAVAGMLLGFPTMGDSGIEDEPEVGRLYAQEVGPYRFEVKISEMETQLVRHMASYERRFKKTWLRFRVLRSDAAKIAASTS